MEEDSGVAGDYGWFECEKDLATFFVGPIMKLNRNFSNLVDVRRRLKSWRGKKEEEEEEEGEENIQRDGSSRRERLC